ncbi:uncharacterized protein LOC144644434 isoform X1 [Oculina patagonica]
MKKSSPVQSSDKNKAGLLSRAFGQGKPKSKASKVPSKEILTNRNDHGSSSEDLRQGKAKSKERKLKGPANRNDHGSSSEDLREFHHVKQVMSTFPENRQENLEVKTFPVHALSYSSDDDDDLAFNAKQEDITQSKSRIKGKGIHPGKKHAADFESSPGNFSIHETSEKRQSSIQGDVSQDSMVPLEIIARGPSARKAYQKALEDGKTQVRRIPVMLVGQERSGKTSLKKSLKGDRFDPQEGSTVGIDVDPSHFQVSTEIWRSGESHQGENPDHAISYEHHAAKFICDNLKEEELSWPKPTVSFGKDKPTEHGTPEKEKREEEKQQVHQNPIPEVPDEIAKLTKRLLDLPINNDVEEIFSVLWDFGGQSVYYATHPIFLTPRAIYLLIYDMSRDPNDVNSSNVATHGSNFSAQRNVDDLEFWMSSISLLAVETNDKAVVPGSENLPTKLPPVILVCTHADEPYNGGDAKGLAQQMLDCLQNKPFSGHLHNKVFAADNTKSGSKSQCPEVLRLRKEVLAVAEQLLQRKEEIPIKWLKYEKALQAMREDGHKYLLLDTAKKIACEACDIRDEEFVTLLNFLHDQRILIHFGETPALDKVVVLDPQWLIDVFKKIIAAKPHIPKGGELEVLWSEFERTGILQKRVIEYEWTPFLNSEDTFESLLKIMEKFSLICPWPSIGSSEQYLVPSMLKSHPTEGVLDLLASASVPSLFLKFDSGHVPQGFFPRMLLQFIQWCHEEWSSQRQPRMFNNFARFFTSLQEGQSVILLCHSTSIEIGVHRLNPSENSMNLHKDPDHEVSDVTVCRKVRRQLGLMLECMRNEFHWLRNVRHKMYVRCPVCSNEGIVRYCGNHDMKDCKQEDCLHFLSEAQLCESREPIVCLKSAVSKDVRVDIKRFQPWFEFLDKQEQDSSYKSNDIPLPFGKVQEEPDLSLPAKVLESLQTNDAADVVDEFQSSLKIDEASLRQPDAGTKGWVRCLFKTAVREKKLDLVEHLRQITPAGTTGPVLPERLDVREIPVSKMWDLTIHLSGGDEWALLAEKFGLTPAEIRYLDKRTMNPCDAALGFVANRYRVTVGDLYSLLVDCGFPALADLL